MNLENQEYPWWGTGEKPENLLLIGGTDGYVILLDCSDGCVKAYLRSSVWQDADEISQDFGLFFRGVGTAYLKKSEVRNSEVFAENLVGSGGSEKNVVFWSELISGIA